MGASTFCEASYNFNFLKTRLRNLREHNHDACKLNSVPQPWSFGSIETNHDDQSRLRTTLRDASFDCRRIRGALTLLRRFRVDHC